MKVLCLTGSIGMGKSTAAATFASRISAPRVRRHASRGRPLAWMWGMGVPLSSLTDADTQGHAVELARCCAPRNGVLVFLLVIGFSFSYVRCFVGLTRAFGEYYRL